MFTTMRKMLAGAALFAQPFSLAGSSSTTVPVSPSTMATIMSVVDAQGKGELELLVLWRGSPAWFWRAGGRGGGGGSSMSGGSMGAGRSEMRTELISQGGVSLHLKFEPASRRLWILEQEVTLNDSNVVLVDEVDSASGPRVIGTIRIDPAFDSTSDLPPGIPAGRPGLPRPAVAVPQTFIRRSPELVAFLQCDVKAPNVGPREQQALDMWCAWVMQP